MAKKNEKVKKLAAQLAEISRGSDGRPDAARVKLVLDELAKAFPPQILRPLLSAFYADVARALRFSEVRIEYAGTLPDGTAESLAKHFSEAYARTVVPEAEENPALLGGLRVQVGDDVYDASLAGALSGLRAALAA